jgi:hypothetical protein
MTIAATANLIVWAALWVAQVVGRALVGLLERWVGR